MKCAKHGNDITNLPNKEQFGAGWLCRYAIWDSQTVNDLFLKQDAQDEYQNRKANPPSKAEEARAFFATNPTTDEIQAFIVKLKK